MRAAKQRKIFAATTMVAVSLLMPLSVALAIGDSAVSDAMTTPDSARPAICCNCTKGTARYCIQGVTDAPNGACSNVTTSPTFQSLNTANPGVLSGFTCSGAPLSAAGCSFGATASVCAGPPHTLAELPGLLRGSATTASASSTPEPPFVSITPILGVTLPGLTLSPAVKTDGVVSVPFLSQYISAAYRYLITISIIVAIVMVVYGGFRYLVGSAFGDIKRGQQIVQDAIAGLLIILGAYTILQTVNPNTLNLRVIELSSVQNYDIDSELERTHGNTGLSEDTGANYADCPVQLQSAPAVLGPNALGTSDPRTVEFRQRIQALIPPTPLRSCVQQVAAAASKCGIAVSSCGNTQSWINNTCAPGTNHGRDLHVIGPLQRQYIRGRFCVPGATAPSDVQSAVTPDVTVLNAPSSCGSTLRSDVFEHFRQAISGWPDNWAADLQPGDGLYIYNANDGDLFGQHAVIFMGWVSDGVARLINGGWGMRVWESRLCLKSSCGNPFPITKTFRLE